MTRQAWRQKLGGGIGLVLILALGASCSGGSETPRVMIKTDRGDIILEIYADRAPVTAANFLRHVDEGVYDGASFYRVVTMDNQPRSEIKIEVIQGGLMRTKREAPSSPIPHETTEQTGVKHVDGALSMARDRPGTASSEFFICIHDQPELDFGGRRNPDGQGFAAFGRVIEGMDVVRQIQSVDAPRQYLETPIPILGITRLKKRRPGLF